MIVKKLVKFNRKEEKPFNFKGFGVEWSVIIQIVRKFIIDMKDHKKEKLKALKKADEKLKKENRKKKKNKKKKI